MMNIYLNSFEKHLQDLKRLKPSSCARYRNHVTEFFAWHAGNARDGLKSEITGSDIQRYLESCRSRGNGNQTRLTKLTALQNFFRYLVFTKVLSNDPTAGIRRPVPDNDIVHRFTRDEVLKMFAVCDLVQEKGIRDAAFLIMAAIAGLRVDEVVSLNVEQLFDNGICIELNLIKPRQGGNRTVSLWETPSAVLRLLLSSRLAQGARKGDPLLVSYKKSGQPRGNRRLNTVALDKLLKTLARRAQIQKPVIKTHMLRTSHIRDLQLCGYSTPQIMEHLGWRTLEPVSRYFSGQEKISQEYESLSEYWIDFKKIWISKDSVNGDGGNADRG